MSQGPLNGHFTTRNRMQRPNRVTMKLVDGTFSDLEGVWDIESLGEDGCKLSLTMRFAFSNPVKDLLLGAAFETTCSRLVDAFVARARSVYG
jgi:ribosome-associated toxin RatA of RatAB toxin-antitoxin module